MHNRLNRTPDVDRVPDGFKLIPHREAARTAASMSPTMTTIFTLALFAVAVVGWFQFEINLYRGEVSSMFVGLVIMAAVCAIPWAWRKGRTHTGDRVLREGQRTIGRVDEVIVEASRIRVNYRFRPKGSGRYLRGHAHFDRVLPLGPRSKILVRYLPESPTDAVLEGFRGSFGT